MGRINLTPLRVRQRALANLESKRTRIQPVWVDVIGEIPPAQIFTRQQPQQHPVTEVRARSLPDGKLQQTASVASSSSASASSRKSRKPSRLFAPVEIKYEEDELRRRFFSDHPWELARPRVVLETTGDQHKHADWSKGLIQPGIPLSGESVVQRQLYLLQTTPDITTAQAYDIARREFYVLRRQEDTRRRIAREEALHMGASAGKSFLQWGMQVENQHYDDWEKWSRNVNMENMQRFASFSGETMAVEQEALKDGEQESDGVQGRQPPPAQQYQQRPQLPGQGQGSGRGSRMPAGMQPGPRSNSAGAAQSLNSATMMTGPGTRRLQLNNQG